MQRFIPKRPSPAMVVACMSLFIALTGVTYAATGGNFILGQANSATSRTSLSAPIANRALQVTNTSTGTGATALGLSVARGKPPLAVNSAAKVANLNADLLDGRHADGIVRAAGSSTLADITFETSQKIYPDPVTITAPSNGLVVVNAGLTVRNDGCTTGCRTATYLRHLESGQTSFGTDTTVPDGGFASGSDGFVFSVKAGTNTFTLNTYRQSGNGFLTGWTAHMTAIFVPFGTPTPPFDCC